MTSRRKKSGCTRAARKDVWGRRERWRDEVWSEMEGGRDEVVRTERGSDSVRKRGGCEEGEGYRVALCLSGEFARIVASSSL